MNPDLTRLDERKNIIDEIESEENYSRKRESQRRFDCYKDRGDRYILEKLRKEFSADSVANMRTITSINISKRVIDALSSVYEREPERSFVNATDRELIQLQNLYDLAFFNTKMKISNSYFNLYEQGTLYFYPQEGVIKVKPLPSMAFDVVPDHLNPEKAYAYILSTWDLDKHSTNDDLVATDNAYRFNDFQNQKIADDSDRLAKKSFVVWTNELHFTMNGKGEIISEIVPNPIGMLPFVDFAFDKDSQFFVRRGSDVTEFHVDMGVVLSDIATISRNQGYAQGVVVSETQPKVIKTNHDKWLWLPLNPDRPELTPSMQFISPNPDLNGSLKLAEILLNMFLSSRGLDTSTITSSDGSQKYSSGVERLLSMLDRFSASQDDFSMYKWVEMKSFELMKAWSNVLQNVTGDLELVPELRGAQISDQVYVQIKFKGPEQVKSSEEKLAEIEREIELGLSTQRMAIKKYHELDDEAADALIEEIDGENRTDQDDEVGSQPDDQP